MTVLPVTGMVLSIVGFLGIHAANLALTDLKDKAWPNVKEEKFIRPFGDNIASMWGSVPAMGLPVILFVIWLILIISIRIM